MAHSLGDPKWFAADVVEETTFEGSDKNIVEITTVLIEAASPQEAYEKATLFGQEGDSEYVDLNNNKARSRFRGIHKLEMIYFELRHGTELRFEERAGVPEAELCKLIKPKTSLEAFLPVEEFPPFRDDRPPQDVQKKLVRIK